MRLGGGRVPYFFLSYAPDEDDIFVQRFYRDLATEVRLRIGGDSRRDVGYLDDAGRSGSHWPVDARLALTTCQTFVALCSAKYLLNGRCGRSWGVFLDRLRDYHRSTGRHAPALIPVMWAGQGVPDGAFREDGLVVDPHVAPEGEDLRVLMRLDSRRSAYRAFVSSLAHRVVDTAHSQRLPPSPAGTDIATATNPFEQRPRQPTHGERRQQVFFVVAAGTRDQMRAIRDDLRFYGRRREDWAPFQPGVPQPLATHARAVAAGRLFPSEVMSIEDLSEWLPRARRHGDIVILLLDAWATKLASLRAVLDDIGRRADAEVAVLVPTSRDDPETTAHQKELRTAVQGTFPGRTGRRDLMFHLDIDSVSSFDDDLATALAEAQHRIYRSGQARRKAAAGSAGNRPILDGP
jgi:FxsC-like protein